MSDKPSEMRRPLIRYDQMTDVLYLIVSHENAVRCVEDANGIVWRYGACGDLVGATIVDYHDRWGASSEELVSNLSARIHVPPGKIDDVLNRKRSAAAADDLDDETKDHYDILENPVAASMSAGDFRAARVALKIAEETDK